VWLTIDIGNSAAKGGLYDGDALAHIFHVDLTDPPLREAPDAEQWADRLAAEMNGVALLRAGIASVVPAHTPLVESALAEMTGHAPTLVAPELELPFRLAYDTPETLGADRLAAAAVAWRRFGQPTERPVVAIDAGTAITYDVVTPPGTYRGGGIAPGPALLRRALHTGTAQLPEVSLEFPESVIGASTSASIQSGIMSALIDSVEGMIARIRRELSADPIIVVTGGWSTLLSTHLAAIDHVEPHLVLDGIRLLMALNPQREASEE
jgi:type III pantothenate kinase